MSKDIIKINNDQTTSMCGIKSKIRFFTNSKLQPAQRDWDVQRGRMRHPGSTWTWSSIDLINTSTQSTRLLFPGSRGETAAALCKSQHLQHSENICAACEPTLSMQQTSTQVCQTFSSITDNRLGIWDTPPCPGTAAINLLKWGPHCLFRWPRPRSPDDLAVCLT